MKLLKILLVALILFQVQPSPCFPQAARTLTNSAKVIKDKAGKEIFEKEIVGKEVSLPKLPSGINREDLLRLLFNTSNKLPAGDDLQGPFAVAYPGLVGLYVAAAAVKDWSSEDNPLDLKVAVFRLISPHKLEAVAQAARPLKLMCRWEFVPDSPDENALHEDEFVAIDKAVYNIGTNNFAFALKLAHNESYAGGFAVFQSLHLMTIEGKSVEEIATVPVYALQNFAGDWNRDGSRQHEVHESKLVLVFLPSEHDGHKDILVKQVAGGHRSFNLSWSQKVKRYLGGKDHIALPYK